MSAAQKPTETNAVPIDTTVVQGNVQILCRGTHVYQTGLGGGGQGADGQGDTLDPGLVMTGTKCGVDSVRWGGGSVTCYESKKSKDELKYFYKI